MAAGQIVTTGRIPNERIATAYEDTDSATFTTVETVLTSLTASLVSGRTYRVKLVTRIGTTVSGDSAIIRVREDSITGNEMVGDITNGFSSSSAGNLWIVEHEYTATATGSKTFVATAVRNSGTGSLRREAASTRPTYLYVEYIRG